MRRAFYILLLLCLSTAVRAQDEVPFEIDASMGGGLPAGTEMLGGGYLIDMNLVEVGFTPEGDYTLQLPDLQRRDFNRLFRLDNRATYGRTSGSMFGRGQLMHFTTGGMGLGFWDATDNVQMGSFRLRNGLRINTYGDYDSSGRRVYNPARQTPWDRNTFRGAFELKSSNGHFGIRVEVQRR